MISIVVAASKQDKKFWSAIQNILSRSFNSIHCIGGCVDVKHESAELLLADSESFDMICSETAIVIFKDSENLNTRLDTQKQAVAIVDSRNRQALKLASETGLPAITCGLSQRDTITLSSINEDSAVIDLQRAITCFDGKVTEPQEIPVSIYSPIDSFALMCISAVFILSGNIERLSKIKI